MGKKAQPKQYIPYNLYPDILKDEHGNLIDKDGSEVWINGNMWNKIINHELQICWRMSLATDEQEYTI